MTQNDKPHYPQPPHAKPPLVDIAAQERQKAEEKEIAGRHKNDGKNEVVLDSVACHFETCRSPEKSFEDVVYGGIGVALFGL